MPAIGLIVIDVLFEESKKQKLNNTSKVYTTDCEKINPRSCAIIHAEIQNKDLSGKKVLIEIDKHWKQINWLLTINQLGKIIENKVPFVILNLG
uniref:DDE-1 domain-containing protein n=1 Tax=Strongyloides stercoralis TaxID=6248 RepID=A0A0K0EMM7_STRER